MSKAYESQKQSNCAAAIEPDILKIRFIIKTIPRLI